MPIRQCAGQAPMPRRPLPEIDARQDEATDPPWMLWRPAPPAIPGWYWVWAKGLWPKIVEYRWSDGVVKAFDHHSEAEDSPFWSICAGPIPDPVAPSMLYYRTKGRR